DGDTASTASDTTAAHARRRCRPQQCEPRETAKGMDRDSRSRDRQWRDLFPCAGTIDVQQDPCATSHDSTQHLSRDGIVQQVRLCALQNIGTYKRAEDLLLSLPRFGWMEVSQRCGLQ